MRSLGDYAVREWMRAQPLAHGLRRLRNRAIDRYYVPRKAEGQVELLSALKPRVKGEELAVTIAFNFVETIDWLSRALKRHAPNIVLVVCDNSTSSEARREIEELCISRGCPYFAMPRLRIPFLQKNPSRSYGLALNWAFYNVIRPLEPAAFIVLDHDIIPTAPVSLRKLVATQPVYGRIVRRKFGSWSLWAGYSVFDFAATGHLPLDFGTDFPLGLDTGGQNWHVLYRHLNPLELRFARTRRQPFLLDDGSRVQLEMIDDWIHIGHVSYWPDARERISVFEKLFPRLIA